MIWLAYKLNLEPHQTHAMIDLLKYNIFKTTRALGKGIYRLEEHSVGPYNVPSLNKYVTDQHTVTKNQIEAEGNTLVPNPNFDPPDTKTFTVHNLSGGTIYITLHNRSLEKYRPNRDISSYHR